MIKYVAKRAEDNRYLTYANTHKLDIAEAREFDSIEDIDKHIDEFDIEGTYIVEVTVFNFR